MTDNVSSPSARHGVAPPQATSETRQVLANLRAEISDYANGVDRLRDLVKAYKIASQLDADGVKESLYWPHLLEMLEEMIPGDEGVDRAMVAVSRLDAN